MAYKLCRRKAAFLTVITFSLTLFMVLNLMMIEISHQDQQDDLLYREKDRINIQQEEDRISYRRNIQRSKKSINSDEFQHEFDASAQFKPVIHKLNSNLDSKQNGQQLGKRNSQTQKSNSAQTDKYNLVKLIDTSLNEDKDLEKNVKGSIKTNADRSIKESEIINKDYVREIEAMEDLDDDYDDDEDDEYYNDNYEYDDKITYKPNRPFQPGDFENVDVYHGYKKPKLQFEEVPTGFEEQKFPKKKILQTFNEEMPMKHSKETVGLPKLVEDGIYWSENAESLIPKGPSYTNIIKAMTSLRSQVVRRLEQPTWNRCGRPKNGFVVLANNKTVCARYRQPHTAFVFGEVLSFYLSRLLGMDNVPAVVLAKTNSTSKQWRAVNISSLGWKDDKTIAFIQWIDNLDSGLRSKSYIPPLFLQAYKTGQPIRQKDIIKHQLETYDSAFISDLIQWGTMIVFDYLTGNYDRVASMQDAAEKEHNPHIMEEAIRNLPKSSSTNKLWLIDNESGLLDAYHLLQSPRRSSTRFTNFHHQMLHTTCVFQKSLVSALFKLADHRSPHTRLLNFAMSHETLLKEIPKDKYYSLFVSLFDKRLNDVKDWMNECIRNAER